MYWSDSDSTWVQTVATFDGEDATPHVVYSRAEQDSANPNEVTVSSWIGDQWMTTVAVDDALGSTFAGVAVNGDWLEIGYRNFGSLAWWLLR